MERVATAEELATDITTVSIMQQKQQKFSSSCLIFLSGTPSENPESAAGNLVLRITV
jgi:hypothetical protein